MEGKRLEGIKGWLLVYFIGSIPLLMVYSMGLSGWFFEYPFSLMVAIFLVLAIPLLLFLLKSPKAPRWNITLWRSVAVLIILRSISIFLEPGSEGMSGDEAVSLVLTLLPIVSIAIGWTMVWTEYLRKSVRVRNTFCQKAA